VMLLGGGLLGIGAPVIVTFLPHGHWVRLDLPVEDAVSFSCPVERPEDYLPVDREAFISTKNGQLLRIVYGPTGSISQTDLVKTLVPLHLTDCRERIYSLPVRPAPPGKVVSIHDEVLHSSDSSFYIRFIILENGQVWKWFTWESPMHLYFFLPLSVIFGAILGFGTSFVLLRKKHRYVWEEPQVVKPVEGNPEEEKPDEKGG
jgi:hypothetical protein